MALLVLSCAKVRAIHAVPEISFGYAASFPTIEALTDAPMISGKFPLMLRDIQNAKSTITFAQYLVKGGILAAEFARSFAERCQAGIKVYILFDSQGSSDAPDDLAATLLKPGCELEYFRRVQAAIIAAS